MAPERKGFTGRLALVLAMVALCAGTLLFLAYEAGEFHFFGHRYVLKAVLPTSSSLEAGASVTMAGAQVGQVTGVQHVGNGTLVTMAISNKSVTPVPVNTRVALRETTPIGENYVEIDPGSAKTMLTSGAVLPITQANQYVDVDQLLDALQGSTTKRTRELIDALGSAVGDRSGDLNATLAGVTNTVQPVAAVTELLHRQAGQAATLVRELGVVASAAGSRGQSIIALAHGSLGTFRAVASEDTSLGKLLDVLPGTLTSLKHAANSLNAASITATPVVTKLARTIDNLKPAIQSLAPAAADGRKVVKELNTTAPGLTTTLTDVRRVSDPLSTALPGLRAALCQANPILKYAKPYTNDIISFASWFGSATNPYDDISHLVPIVAVAGDDSVLGEPPAVESAEQELLHSGALENTTSLSWDPYPAPNQIGKEHAGDGTPNVIGPSQVKSVGGYTYPHITEDCTA
jgi:phospholipid/cholesterol/gamma-HCH transport system substrate-binding protein